MSESDISATTGGGVMLADDFVSVLRALIENLLEAAAGAETPATAQGNAQRGEEGYGRTEGPTAQGAQDGRLVATLVSLCLRRTTGDIGHIVEAVRVDPALVSLFLAEPKRGPVAAEALARQVAVRLLLPTLRRLRRETGSLCWDEAAWDRVLRWLDDCVVATSQVVVETTFLRGLELSGPPIEIEPGLSMEWATGAEEAWLSEREMHSHLLADRLGRSRTRSCIRRRFEIPKRPPFTGWNDKTADTLVSALRIHQPGAFWPTWRHWRILQPTLAAMEAVAPVGTASVPPTSVYRLAGDDPDDLERLRTTFAGLDKTS
jgi:hypothetical protein